MFRADLTVVNLAINFDDQFELMTIKIRDEPLDRMLLPYSFPLSVRRGGQGGEVLPTDTNQSTPDNPPPSSSYFLH